MARRSAQASPHAKKACVETSGASGFRLSRSNSFGSVPSGGPSQVGRAIRVSGLHVSISFLGCGWRGFAPSGQPATMPPPWEAKSCRQGLCSARQAIDSIDIFYIQNFYETGKLGWPGFRARRSQPVDLRSTVMVRLGGPSRISLPVAVLAGRGRGRDGTPPASSPKRAARRCLNNV